jgi:hypothetical protein
VELRRFHVTPLGTSGKAANCSSLGWAPAYSNSALGVPFLHSGACSPMHHVFRRDRSRPRPATGAHSAMAERQGAYATAHHAAHPWHQGGPQVEMEETSVPSPIYYIVQTPRSRLLVLAVEEAFTLMAWIVYIVATALNCDPLRNVSALPNSSMKKTRHQLSPINQMYLLVLEANLERDG